MPRLRQFPLAIERDADKRNCLGPAPSLRSERMKRALVGSTGFVGGNLLRQLEFDALFHSKNSEELRGQDCEELWFAGLPATKWAANREPESDLAKIEAIQRTLSELRCGHFVLISTIDVYNDQEPYGRHRRDFEGFVRQRFPEHTILRLPGLFGKGLKKNVLFDLLTGNRVDQVHEGDAYQWYDLADLVADIDVVRQARVAEADLFTEPLDNRRILELFPERQVCEQDRQPRRDDFRSPLG